jgi:hypothetical protein
MHLGPLPVPLLVQGQRHMRSVEGLLAQQTMGLPRVAIGADRDQGLPGDRDGTRPGPSYATQYPRICCSGAIAAQESVCGLELLHTEPVPPKMHTALR